MKYISNEQRKLPVQVAPVTEPIVVKDEAHLLSIYHTNPFQEVILVRTETNPMTGEVLSMREIVVSVTAAARGFFNNVSPSKKGREELRPKAQRSYVYQKIGFVGQQKGIYQALSGQVNTGPQNPLSAAELFALLPDAEKAKLQAMLAAPPAPSPETMLVDTPLFIDDEQPAAPKRTRRKPNTPEPDTTNPLANL